MDDITPPKTPKRPITGQPRPATFDVMQPQKRAPVGELRAQAQPRPQPQPEPQPEPRTTPEPVVEPPIQKQPPEQKSPKASRMSVRRHWYLVIGIILLAVAGYIGADAWLTANKTQATDTGNQANNAAVHSKENEGKDEAEVTPSALDSYKVASDLPRALYIDSLNIAARVLPMSVNTDGSMQAPLNIFDSGWYTGSVKPGEDGAMFIDGHASGPTRQGIFAYLDTLKVGNTLQIEKGDGQRLTYRVLHVETMPLEGLDMRKALNPHGDAKKALNLMTCTGNWIESQQTYDQRVMVYTEQVQ